jgi:hypothetical protein
MKTVSQICPVCEGISPWDAHICRACGQDLRITPLKDYQSFISKPFGGRRQDLAFQFGTLKHKINISFNSLKLLVHAGKLKKIPRVFSYYKRQIELEQSSVSYYLLLHSRELFIRFFESLFKNCHSYFVLWGTYISRPALPASPALEAVFNHGFNLIEEQNDRLTSLIEEIIENIEAMEEEKIAAVEWKSPPPPPVATSVGRKI